MLSRIATLLYGALAYLGFLGVLAYTMGFLANRAVAKGIDDGTHLTTATAIAIDLGLLGLFAVQHSVMARPWFKRAWTRIVPTAVERTTYVAAASAVGSTNLVALAGTVTLSVLSLLASTRPVTVSPLMLPPSV